MVKRLFVKICFLVFCPIGVLLLSSCQGLFGYRRDLGYAMLLWAVPDKNLLDGDVVRVCVKSNISRVWICQEDADGKQGRFELPLWMLDDPVSKKKAQFAAAQYAPYQGRYACAALDGLPIRIAPDNASKRVYRLKIGQVVNVLRSWSLEDGKMEIPQSGGVPLDGQWLLVITNDGTEGWCFSHNLSPFSLSRGQEVSG